MGWIRIPGTFAWIRYAVNSKLDPELLRIHNTAWTPDFRRYSVVTQRGVL